MEEILTGSSTMENNSSYNRAKEIFKDSSSAAYGGNSDNNFDTFDIKHELIVGNVSEYERTKGQMFMDKMTLTNKDSKESMTAMVDVLFVPVKSETGYTINNRNKQVVSLYKRAPGWYIKKDKKSDTPKVIAEYIVESNTVLMITITPKNIKVNKGKKANAAGTVSISTFLRALTKSSFDEILAKLGASSSTLLRCIQNDIEATKQWSIADCINRTLTILEVRNLEETRDAYDNYNRLIKIVSPYGKFRADEVNRNRLESLISFRSRAVNKTLSRELTFTYKDDNGENITETLAKGTILTAQVLENIDKSSVDTLFVEYLGSTFELKKYPIARNTKGDRIFSVDEFFTIINIAVSYLDGYPLALNEFELTNRLVQDLDGAVCNELASSLNELNNRLTGLNFRFDENSASVIDILDNIKYKPNAWTIVNQLTDQDSKDVQSSDIDNIVAFEAKNSKIMMEMGGRGGDDMTKVQDSQAGRLDPLDQPESQKIGTVHIKTHIAKINDLGELTSPYIKVVNGVPDTSKIIYLTASEEENKYIAEWNETFEKDRVKARIDGRIVTVDKNQINYMQYCPVQDMSLPRTLIPFQNHNNPKRLQMACNHFKQAEVLDRNERPLVSTGFASIAEIGIFTAKKILTDYWNELKIKPAMSQEDFINQKIYLKDVVRRDKNRELTLETEISKDIIVKSLPFVLPTSAKTFFMYKINAQRTRTYQGNDIIAFNSAVSIDKCNKFIRAAYGNMPIEDTEFTSSEATGINLRVLYKTMGSSTVDDALVISDELLYDGLATSLVVSHLDYELKSSNDGLKIETFGKGSGNTLDYIQENGLPKIGTYLKHGDVFMTVVKQVYKIDEVTNKKVLESSPVIYKRIENYVEGTVMYAEKHGDSATVLIAHNAEIEVGDKWSGRHGNKGVTAKIVPASQMPYGKDGKPVQLILNPLGIPSRMNIGQVIEVILAYAMRKQDKYAIVSPYYPNGLEMVKEQAQISGVTPEYMWDGRTGKRFKRPMLTGYIYMQKLVHRVSKKITARGLGGSVDQVTLQPTKGKGVGGQSIGEMETWILEATGCLKFLQELMTVQSDDLPAKEKLISIIESNILKIDPPETENRNDKALQVLTRMMGVELSFENGEVSLEPLTNEIITTMAKKIDIRSVKDLQDPEKFGNTFVSSKGDYSVIKAKDYWYYIDLHTEIVHPLWLYHQSPLLKVLFVLDETASNPTVKNFSKNMRDALIGRKAYIRKTDSDFYSYTTTDIDENCYTGMQALCMLIRHIDLKKIKKQYQIDRDKLDDRKMEDKEKLFNIMEIINRLESKGFNPEDYIIKYFPVIPKVWRPESPIENVTNDFDKRYEAIGRAALSLKDSYNENQIDAIYKEICALLGLYSLGPNSSTRTDLNTVMKYFVDKGLDGDSSNSDGHGYLRSKMLSKRIDMSARSVITPQQDINRRPTELGVPLYIVCKIYSIHLQCILKRNGYTDDEEVLENILGWIATQDVDKVDEVCGKGSFERFIGDIEEFLKTRVVVCGRQPSLHNSSIRAYKPYLVFTKAIQINPLVCTGYNADFDGDQMWIAAPISNEAQEEVWNKLSIYTGIISPKDSSCLLDHSQDSLLGMYFGTMLYENVTSVIQNPKYFLEGTYSEDASKLDESCVNYFIYDNIKSLETDIDNCTIELQDLVLFVHESGRRYMSTAGRILLNSKLPDAFTEEPFTNTLNIPLSEKTKSNIFNLKYDKLFCKGDKSNGIEVQSVKKLNIEIYNTHSPEDTVEYFHQMMVYGLKYSELSGISLTLDDIETYKYSDEYFSRMKILEDEINRDFDAGMITEDEKRRSLIASYKELTNILKERVMSEFPRNNNLFIMFESGARGSEGQILHTVGIIGITAKTATEELETPIATSYSEGLSCFDTFLSSFSGRASLKSTQLGTAKSGYATRQATFMSSGLKIVEHDCGKDIEPLKLLYSHPMMLTFKNENGESKNIKVSKDDAYSVISDLFKNRKVNFDSEMQKEYKSFLKGGRILNMKGIKVLLKNKVKHIDFLDDSSIDIKYALEPMLKDLLLNREVDKSELLPGLVSRYYMTQETVDYIRQTDINTQESIAQIYGYDFGVGTSVEHGTNLPGLLELKFSSAETVAYLEKNNIEEVKIRLFLDCHSEGGCCARCYGVKFDTLELPEIGETIGITAAQSIGEPSTQLTMNMAHTGSSVSSGVAFFQSLLKSTNKVFGLDSKESAMLALDDGYVSIRPVGKSSIVTVTPTLSTNKHRTSTCSVEFSIPSNMLDVFDGQYVRKGTPLSKGILSPNKYGSDLKGNLYIEPRELIKARMLIVIKLYFDVFAANKLDIHARHFEVFARLQNLDLMIASPNVSLDDKGDIVVNYSRDNNEEVQDNLVRLTYPQLLKVYDNLPKNCSFYHNLVGQGEVILQNSGPLTLMSFEQICKFSSILAFSKYSGKERAMMGNLAIGQNLADPEYQKNLTKKPKHFGKPIIKKVSKLDSFSDVNLSSIQIEELEEEIIDKENEAINEAELQDLFTSLDLGDLGNMQTFDTIGLSLEETDADLPNLNTFNASNDDDFDFSADDFFTEIDETISPDNENENHISMNSEEGEDYVDMDTIEDFIADDEEANTHVGKMNNF